MESYKKEKTQRQRDECNYDNIVEGNNLVVSLNVLWMTNAPRNVP
jgi:hypothetical protein